MAALPLDFIRFEDSLMVGHSRPSLGLTKGSALLLQVHMGGGYQAGPHEGLPPRPVNQVPALGQLGQVHSGHSVRANKG